MLDQNITTILTTLLTVLGTLGGAVLGVILTNHHALRVEALKVKQEKASRDIEAVKEVYLLLIKISHRFDQNIKDGKDSKDGLDEEVGKVKTLVRLFLPSIVPSLDRWLAVTQDLDELILLENFKDTVSDMKGQGKAKGLTEKWDFQRESRKRFHESLDAIYVALEKHVR